MPGTDPDELCFDFWTAVAGPADNSLVVVDQPLNDTQEYRRIKSISVGMLADLNSVCDFSTLLFRKSDGKAPIQHGWDHYANPTVPANENFDFHDKYVRWFPGDQYSIGVRLSAPTPVHAMVIMTVRYTVG